MSRTRAQGQDIEEQRAERLRQTGRAIRHARGELTQSELGERLAPFLGEPVPQTTISRWESGAVSLDLETLHAIEGALDLQPGTLGQIRRRQRVTNCTQVLELVLGGLQTLTERGEIRVA